MWALFATMGARAVVPTATGLGDLKWRQPTPGDYDPCVSPLVAGPAIDLYGVVPDQISLGYFLRELEVVFGSFEGSAKGEAIEAALTKQLGAPYEPNQDDLYWTTAGGAVSVRLTRNAAAPAELALVHLPTLSEHRSMELPPQWWMITLEEARATVGVGSMPAWSGISPERLHMSSVEAWVCLMTPNPGASADQGATMQLQLEYEAIRACRVGNYVAVHPDCLRAKEALAEFERLPGRRQRGGGKK